MLVDSSVWIDFLNGTESAEADLLARALADDDPVFVTGLVLTEVLQGIANDSEAQCVSALLGACPAVGDMSTEDYVRAAGLYRACRAIGRTPRSTVDCIIAQLCIRNRLPLLTRDQDFATIAMVSALQIVDAQPV